MTRLRGCTAGLRLCCSQTSEDRFSGDVAHISTGVPLNKTNSIDTTAPFMDFSVYLPHGSMGWLWLVSLTFLDLFTISGIGLSKYVTNRMLLILKC